MSMSISMSARSAARAAAAAATRHRRSAHAARGPCRQAGGGGDGRQPPGTYVAVGAAGRRVGIGHGPALVEDGVTGRTAEFVDGHEMDLLRSGSLRERPVTVSSSPHSTPLHGTRRYPDALKPGRAKAPGCVAFQSAGHE